METQQYVAPVRADAETRVQEAEAMILQQPIITALNFVEENDARSFQRTTAIARHCIDRDVWSVDKYNKERSSNRFRLHTYTWQARAWI
jgi:hypothetical protein